MRFSVVIPVKNRTDALRRTLLSLRLQSFKDFEVIVVDDGSEEDIKSVVDEFGDLSTKVLRLPGCGAPTARNYGTDAAEAPFVAYLDSDDIFLPDKLATLSNILSDSTAEVLASPLYVWRGSGPMQRRPSRPPKPSEDISEFYFVADQRMQSSSFIVSSDLARRVRWNENLKKVQDPDFMIRLLRSGAKFQFVDEPLAVLFDEAVAGRISSNVHEENLRHWLYSADNPLTNKAKRGFELYVMSYEISKRSKLAAWSMVARNLTAVPLKVVAKICFRLAVSEKNFKSMSQFIMTTSRKPSVTDIHLFIDEITRKSSAAPKLKVEL